MAERRPFAVEDSMFLDTSVHPLLSYAVFANSQDVDLRVLAAIDMLGGEIRDDDALRIMKGGGKK